MSELVGTGPAPEGGASSSTSTSKPTSLLGAFAAGIEMAHAAEDLRVPGVKADARAMLPYVDHDHGSTGATKLPSSTSSSDPKPPSAKSAPPQNGMADHIAALNAASLNLELTTLRYSKDRDAKYKLQDILERADDSATRKKLREFHAASHGGESLDDMITSQEGLDDNARKHAHSLVSEKRDAATDKLAAMDPKARAELEDKAAVWADKLFKVTRSDDRDDSEHADDVAGILGPRSPEELEVIRARVRLQTSGTQRTTIYEELDRTFTGRDKNIALAGLDGDHKQVASQQLIDAAMEGDPERVHRIVKQLGPEKLAELRTINPMLLAQVTSHMPDDARAQVDAELGGRRAEADGARIASLLQPVSISVEDAHDVDTAKRKLARKEAQDPERMIAELQKMSPSELASARASWDQNNSESWDQLIAKQYEGVDSTLRLRIEAAARGDKLGERALRLRQGMRTFDQDLIDQALANPDLKSSDPAKKAAAEAERRELEARMRQYDANDQRTKALIDGKAPPVDVVGRSLDEQLDTHYEAAKNRDTEASGGIIGKVEHVATTDARMERIREKATVDKYAAKEMFHEGDAHASTKVRRAELSENTMAKAEILEGLDGKDKQSTNTLAAQRAEYAARYGNRDMLAAPDLSDATQAAKLVASMTGDERSPEEIAAELVRSDMNVGELRMEHVRQTGVLADRTREQRIAQQTEISDLTHSGWLEDSEEIRFRLGFGNRGSEDLMRSSVNLMKQSGGAGVSDAEFARRDRATTSAVELQRDEKQREAAKISQMISIASKIAAILTANPALFVAVDAGFSALRIAAQEAIANEAYDMTSDLKHMAVDLVVNMATAKLGGLGKGVEAGTQAAKNVQMVQRIGNAGAAMGGAAAHSLIDGEDAGGAIVRAGVGAFVPSYLRGKAEKLANATTRGGRFASDVMGTVIDTGANVAIGGGHIDGGTAVDLIGGSVQGRLHGNHGRKARPDEHAAMATHHVADVDLPRRSPSIDDAIRQTPTREGDPRHSQYAKIEERARDVETRRQAEAAFQAHAHFVEDVGPPDSRMQLHASGDAHAKRPTTDTRVPAHAAVSPGDGSRSGVTLSAAEASKPEVAAASSEKPSNAQGDHRALVDLAVNESRTPEHKEQIVRWGEELDRAEGFGPHREVLREMNLEARKESPYPNKEHGAALREWAHEGQLDRLPMVEALRHEGVAPDAVQHVFDKAVKNDASASVKPDVAAVHTAADGTPLVKPLTDHPDALDREDISFLADIHGRRSDHIHGPYTTSAGRDLPGTPMRKVVPDGAAHDYQTGVRIDRATGNPVPADTVGNFVGAASTTQGRSANEATRILGLDYEGSAYVDETGSQVSPAVASRGVKAAQWNLTHEQEARRRVPFGDDAKVHMQDHREHLESIGAHIPTLYEGDHRLDTYNRGSQVDPGTGWGFSAPERLLDAEGRAHRVEPNQEMTLPWTKLPPFDVVHIPSESQVAADRSAKDVFERANNAKKSGAIDPSLSADVPGLLEAQKQARTSNVDPARQAQREQFEGALANHPRVHELVAPTLDMMSSKLLDYLHVMKPGEVDQHLSNLGAAPSERNYAGAIGTDPDVIREALQSGNVRERMVLLSEFQERVLGEDALRHGGIDEMREKFGARDGAFTLADVERLEALRQQHMESLPPGASTRPKAMFDVNARDSGHSDYATAKAEHHDTKLPRLLPEAASAHLGIPVNTPTGMGEQSPLARANMTTAEANARGLALSERERAHIEAQGSDVVPWVAGSKANIVDPDAPFIRDARSDAMPLKAGISGTTFRGMRLAEVLGANPEMARLALFAQLNPIEAHSFHEIASASQGFFDPLSSSKYDVRAPYTPESTGVDVETLRSVAESMGLSLDELNLYVGDRKNTK